MKIVIPLAPVTKKNSQRILINKATGRPFVMPSEKYKVYEKACVVFMPRLKDPIDYPVNVSCRYYMPTKRRVDLVNLLEATSDIMVRYGILSDDNSNVIYSVDGSRVFYDKEHPRTEIEITPIGEEE